MKDREEQILFARDKRWQRIIAEFKNSDLPVVTFSLNIPGYPKVNEKIRNAFYRFSRDVILLLEYAELFEDEAGLWLIGRANFSNDPREIKKRLVKMEETHPSGRIMDIDVYDIEGPVKRNIKRKCIVCGSDIDICRLESRHTVEEIRMKVMEYL